MAHQSACRHISRSAALALWALLISPATATATTLSFMPLGNLPGGSFDSRAWTVSADDCTIVGWGIDPDGFTDGWIVTVPEPSTLVMAACAIGLLVVASRRHRRQALAALGCVTICLTWTLPAVAVTIPTVPVGNAGNAGEVQSQGSFGSVAYDYRIGTTEVTIGQYTEFLNAVAATDTYALYNPGLSSTPNVAGIQRSGVSGSYTYSVIGSANKPVTYVSWGDAVRFANWLHNGQPSGPQNDSTTEDGAYTLNGAMSPAALNAATRNSGAVWFIPSEDEWYKAAYHRNDGVTGNYWDYPTSTDAIPYSDQPPGSDAPTQSNTANFFRQDGMINGYDDGYAVTGSQSYSGAQNYLTDVGAYALSVSAYGTYDQGGSVWEWNDALIGGSTRGMRGGSWDYIFGYLQASFRTNNVSTHESPNLGFRVATVPEPASAVLAILGCASLLWWRKRYK